MDEPTQEEVNEYLDRLRESGETNMFGSSLYVEAAFGINRRKAIKMVAEWMRTFKDRHPPKE